MRVLVWNLFHGRADPPAGRPLLPEFADALAGWEWDVALLQEVPPWWPPLLARPCGAEWRSALTSRNQFLPLRRAVASRRPDLLKANGGGANAILVRDPWTIAAHGRRRLRWRPERRVVHAVRVERPADRPSGGVGGSSGGVGGSSGGVGVLRVPGVPGGPRSGRPNPRPLASHPSIDTAWIGNVHTQLGRWDTPDGMAAPLADLARSVSRLAAWGSASPDVPLVLGGDFNLPRDVVAANLPHGWSRIATSGPDHVAGRGVRAAGPSQRPDHGPLSDHVPLLVELTTA